MIQTHPFAMAPTRSYYWHTVLIVDDDPQVLAALRRTLELEPYDVVTTSRPGLALEWLERKNISLVISDQRMPEMDGDEFLESVGSLSPRTQRLLLTGYPELLEHIPATRMRSVRIMTKPWDDAAIRSAIRRLLDDREDILEGGGRPPSSPPAV